ncbi:MAG: hypothetical protein LC641_08765 [Spirochaeta sp.]|nr:hypothetical protein [Spirochaeta sp.]
MKNVKTRGPQHLLFVALVVWGIVLAGTRILSPIGMADSIWPGHATFLVPVSHDLSKIDSALSLAGIDSYIGAATARFKYNDFGPLSTVKLSDLESRFDRRDPRLDPYMQSVTNYFHAESEGQAYHVIYVPGDAAILMNRVEPIMREQGVQFLSADTGTPDSGGVPFLVMCAVLGSAFVSRRRAPFVLAAGLPLIVATLRTEDPFSAVAGLLFYLTWVMSFPGIMQAWGAGLGSGLLSAPDTRHGARFRHLVVYMGTAAVVAFVVVLRYSPQALLSLVLSVVAVATAAGAELAVEQRRVAVREHGSFEPIAILPRRLRPRTLPRELYLAPLGALLVVLVVLLVPAANSESTLSIPLLPQPLSTTDGYETVSIKRDEKQLPTIEDYLAHRAFQEAFMYGWDFRLPDIGEVVRIPEFERNNGRIERKDRVVFSFDEDWIAGELDAIGENGTIGIESMLQAAGSPNGVEYRPVRHVYWARSELIHAVIPVVLLLLVPVALRLAALFPTFDTGGRVAQLLYKRRNIEVV